MIELLRQYVDVFAWSYDDMPGLSTNIVSHRLPTNPTRLPVKQKPRKFKPDLSLRIKEEVTKQIEANVVRVTNYPSWLANNVPVPKKDRNIIICVDYRDLNKDSPKDDFSLPNIHILFDNCAKHELQSFVDCFTRYHQFLMHEDDAEKTAFTTPWGVYYYRVMSFGLNNVGATYIRAMTTLFHNMIHKEIEVYVDDVIIKPRKSSEHLDDLRKFLNACKVLDNAFGCVVGKHDETGRKEQAIYYLSKKFTPCEAKYTLIERICCALTWIAQKLRYYMLAYTMHLISRLDPLKYIFQKPMPTGKLAKLQILLSKFDIVYITHKAIKVQALADHLVENLVDGNYKPLTTYFRDEEVLFVGEDIAESYTMWRMFFDGVANFKGVKIGAVLISKSAQHYPASTKIRFPCTNNMAKYKACILEIRMAVDMNIKELLVIRDFDLLIHQVQGEWSSKNVKILPYLHCVKELCKKFTKIEFKHVPRIQNEFVIALATISSMIQHPDKNCIDPIEVEIRDRHAYCFYIDEEPDGKPWYHDIKRFLATREYP
ncbi:uncharacterized protein [Nicotiana tomentosiformis]|uniref:uncharacterized protein n=1 Tax=Nicotiana tomentosiformis TaxID=4098 RepID=UPI00388CCC5F